MTCNINILDYMVKPECSKNKKQNMSAPQEQKWLTEKTVYKLAPETVAFYGEEFSNVKMITTPEGDEYYQWQNNSIHFDKDSPKSVLGAWNKLVSIIKKYNDESKN